ncbi:MAG TPA: FISUMP domain-containing protein [Bacteroidales bacterium]|nr:FISUMP domain-containing protein [Bacteroidales bacterium]
MNRTVITLLIFLLTTGLLLAQAPQAFNYQAVIRDKAGQVLSNQNISLQVSILQLAANGSEVYREIHSVTSNELGLINIEIGKGKNPTGTLSTIDWGSGSHFLKMEMDMEGGSHFELMGVSQLLSVPYALYAEKAGSNDREADLDWEIIGNDVVTGHGGSYPIGNVGIGNNAPGSLLYVAKNTGEPTITIRNLGGGGGATYSMVDDLSGANWKFKATTYGGFKIRDQANALDVLTMEPNSAANTLYIKTGGNVGIGKNPPAEKLDVAGKIRSDQGFNVNGTNGLYDTTNQVTAFDAVNDKLKYRTIIHNGGILIYSSAESGWVDTVIDFILPPFECGDILFDSRDGKTYATVLIDTQCWMAENLNIGTKINSTQSGSQQQDNGTIEKYCYNNDEANCDIYGGLYEWPEAMQYAVTQRSQGICPVGWHVPSDSEWKTLEGSVDSQHPMGDPEWNQVSWRGYDAGGNLRETGTDHWTGPNNGATNSSGFTALPAGIRGGGGDFFVLNSSCYFWNSTSVDTTESWNRHLTSIKNNGVFRGYYPLECGKSIRCLKDCLPAPSQADAGPDQLYIPGTIITLAGNIPDSGSGLWQIVSGTGGVLVNPSSPTSEFQGLAGMEYTLIWTISTICGSTEDILLISFMAETGQPCLGIPTVTWGAQVYNTVQIGTQCWLRENLNLGIMIPSTAGGSQQTDNSIVEKYCYGNNPYYCTIYGGLYEWPETMQYVTTEGAQGICPPGWHIPTDNEWKILEGTVDSQYPVGDPEWDGIGLRGLDAGGNLKEEGTTHWYSPNEGANNSSGFTGLPGGNRINSNGGFSYRSFHGFFWSSTHLGPPLAWYRRLTFDSDDVERLGEPKEFGFSIRCIKDAN